MAYENEKHVDLALKYGNFKGYYNYNTVSSRMKFIEQLFNGDSSSNDGCKLDFKDETICILDCGCNSGDIGYDIAKRIKAQEPNKTVYLLGIDLDGELIDEAKRKHIKIDDDINVEYHKEDIMSYAFFDLIDSFFKRNKLKRVNFDLTLCLSLTMWIHLNYGDDGFNEFLKYLGDNSTYLLVEPQQFHKYTHANKRRREAGKSEFYHYYKIRIKKIDEHIIDYLSVHCDMKLMKHLGVTNWSRNIYLFK